MNLRKETVFLIFQNILVLILLIALMEFFSFSVLYVNKLKTINKNEKIEESYKENKSSNSQNISSEYSSQELKKNLEKRLFRRINIIDIHLIWFIKISCFLLNILILIIEA